MNDTRIVCMGSFQFAYNFNLSHIKSFFMIPQPAFSEMIETFIFILLMRSKCMYESVRVYVPVQYLSFFFIMPWLRLQNGFRQYFLEMRSLNMPTSLFTPVMQEFISKSILTRPFSDFFFHSKIRKVKVFGNMVRFVVMYS